MESLTSKVIVNELLCFMTSKKSVMTTDDIILLCLNSFSDEEISEAKKIMKVVLETNSVPVDRFKKRQGTNRDRKNLEDLLAMIHEMDSVEDGPIFAAINLAKMPPIGFDSIDVSSLLHRMQRMELELTKVKEDLQTHVTRENSRETMNDRRRPSQGYPLAPVQSTKKTPGMQSAGPSSTQSEPRQRDLGGPSTHRGDNRDLNAVTQEERRQQNDWVTVAKKGNKKKANPAKVSEPRATLRGTRSLSGEQGMKISVVETTVNVFTSRWGTDMEEEDVRKVIEHLQGIKPKVTKITTKSTRHRSFLVQLPISDINAVYKAERWPIGINFRRYIYRHKIDKPVVTKANGNSERNNLLL